MRPGTLDDFVRVDQGRTAPASGLVLSGLTPTSYVRPIADGDTPTTLPGTIGAEAGDLIPVILTAGTTYTFAIEGRRENSAASVWGRGVVTALYAPFGSQGTSAP